MYGMLTRQCDEIRPLSYLPALREGTCECAVYRDVSPARWAPPNIKSSRGLDFSNPSCRERKHMKCADAMIENFVWAISCDCKSSILRQINIVVASLR